MTCDVQDLANSANCFACLPGGILPALELQLLCELLASANVLTAPNGTKWRLKVDNLGNLTTEAVT